MHSPAQNADWASLIEDNRSWIERLIIARTGTTAGVDDVLQEVGLAVARSSTRPTAPDEVAPWLCKIVVRQCAHYVRCRIRHQRKLNSFQEDRLSQGGQTPDPIFWLLHEETKTIVREELRKLDGPSRQLLVWKYVHALRYDEIALRLGVTRHVVEYRVVQARKQLRQHLLARGIEGGDLP